MRKGRIFSGFQIENLIQKIELKNPKIWIKIFEGIKKVIDSTILMLA